MHGYLPHVVQGILEVSQNGANVPEYLLIVDAGVYRTHDIEECGDIIVCPLNCFHDHINLLSVDLHGIMSDI